ncbi:hypothetical protein A3C25_05120 [Candidatus Roizmanbacteria bacterium RIFCSPHIGHO2_02_FULL_38_11]|uniref:Uncharacterized protein n=1 Tax=Candidatus Roizmanbacteria bacterium RIFCSPHIGHO2_02_FULL_38_11 TaxID=1802039 RepID=A0A1F7GZ41_9BACT|nr:MAG: hypothetical protein A3C25_05120 [Candidatus Roizmanbacteria bacterium RIFCSPHIGHO2_02_FULL_38_11]
MDNFNRIVSFVLGLIVVIVFLAIVTGRFNIGNRTKNLGGQTKISPTPTVVIGRNLSPTPVPKVPLNQGTVNANKPALKSPTTIPATGAPTLLLSAFFSTLSLGIYLKTKK